MQIAPILYWFRLCWCIRRKKTYA